MIKKFLSALSALFYAYIGGVIVSNIFMATQSRSTYDMDTFIGIALIPLIFGITYTVGGFFGLLLREFINEQNSKQNTLRNRTSSGTSKTTENGVQTASKKKQGTGT